MSNPVSVITLTRNKPQIVYDKNFLLKSMEIEESKGALKISLVGQINTKNDELLRKEDDKLKKQTKLDELNEYINTLNGEISDLGTQITELEGTKADKQTELDQLKISDPASTNISILETDILDLESQIQTLEGTKSDKQTELEGVNESISNLQSEISELENEITELQESIKSLQSENTEILNKDKIYFYSEFTNDSSEFISVIKKMYEDSISVPSEWNPYDIMLNKIDNIYKDAFLLKGDMLKIYNTLDYLTPDRVVLPNDPRIKTLFDDSIILGMRCNTNAKIKIFYVDYLNNVSTQIIDLNNNINEILLEKSDYVKFYMKYIEGDSEKINIEVYSYKVVNNLATNDLFNYQKEIGNNIINNTLTVRRRRNVGRNFEVTSPILLYSKKNITLPDVWVKPLPGVPARPLPFGWDEIFRREREKVRPLSGGFVGHDGHVPDEIQIFAGKIKFDFNVNSGNFKLIIKNTPIIDDTKLDESFLENLFDKEEKFTEWKTEAAKKELVFEEQKDFEKVDVLATEWQKEVEIPFIADETELEYDLNGTIFDKNLYYMGNQKINIYVKSINRGSIDIKNFTSFFSTINISINYPGDRV